MLGRNALCRAAALSPVSRLSVKSTQLQARMASAASLSCQAALEYRAPLLNRKTRVMMPVRLMSSSPPSVAGRGMAQQASGSGNVLAMVGVTASALGFTYLFGMGYQRTIERRDEAVHELALEKAEGREFYHPDVLSRMGTTAAYVAGGLSGTAVSAALLFYSGAPAWMARQNRYLMFGALIVAGVGSVSATALLPKNSIEKKIAFATTSAVYGLVMAPVCAVGGPLLMQAAATTALITASITAMSIVAPIDTFLKFEAPAAIGISAVLALSLARLVSPVPLLQTVALYGGLAFYVGMILPVDVQRARFNAAKNHQYDPIDECLQIYLDVLIIYGKIVEILVRESKKK